MYLVLFSTIKDWFPITNTSNGRALEMTAASISTSALAIIVIAAILIIFFLVWMRMIRQYQSVPEPSIRGTIDDVESQTQPKDVSFIRSFLFLSSRVRVYAFP